MFRVYGLGFKGSIYGFNLRVSVKGSLKGVYKAATRKGSPVRALDGFSLWVLMSTS